MRLKLNGLLAAATAACAAFSMLSGEAAAWDLWDRLQAVQVENARVVDRSDARRITTSEGQSYALFFALAAGDREGFAKLLDWTERNLAGGDLTKRLPAWLWGRRSSGAWGVLDANNASDSDMWIAWCLLEAGRLWEMPDYSDKGRAMLELLKLESRDVRGLGPVVLPGHAGFEAGKGDAAVVKLNPSYAPVFVLRRFALEDPWWGPAADAAVEMIVRSAPSGLSPEWARFNAAGRLVKPEGEDFVDGSYNAIRTYLWAGMLSPEDPARAVLVERLRPMVEATRAMNFPPAHVNVVTGEAGEAGEAGPDYFGACLLPLLSENPDGRRAAALIRTVLCADPVREDRYYGNVLTLFGLGYDERRWRFDAAGRIVIREGGDLAEAPAAKPEMKSEMRSETKIGTRPEAKDERKAEQKPEQKTAPAQVDQADQADQPAAARPAAKPAEQKEQGAPAAAAAPAPVGKTETKASGNDSAAPAAEASASAAPAAAAGSAAAAPERASEKRPEEASGKAPARAPEQATGKTDDNSAGEEGAK